MPTEAQKRATIKYENANIKRVVVKLNERTNADIIQHLEKIDNVQGYIKELILNDMNKD